MFGNSTRLMKRIVALLLTVILSFSLTAQTGFGLFPLLSIIDYTVTAEETEIVFDIAGGSVNLGATYSGIDASGNTVTGSHIDTNKYKVIQSTSEATGNRILLTGSASAPLFDITIEDIDCSGGDNKGGQTSGTNPELSGIRVECKNNKDINLLLRLSGVNRVGRLHYSTNSVSGGESIDPTVPCNSSLTITSASGNGSTNGTLYAESITDWSAAIGGTDNPEHTRNITINGGTIYAKSRNTSAIGGGGNGVAVIEINGGNIEAENNGTGATIGGGGGENLVGAGASVIVNGGVIKATNKGVGTAIGAGSSPAQLGGTGIVTVNGGIINATSKNNGIAIGGGSSTQSGAGGAIVSISGGTIVTSGIGSGYSYSGVPEITSIIISGGSINTTQMTHTPYAADNETSVSMTEFNPENLGVTAAITAIDFIDGYVYGTNDMYTDEYGRLYLWYPSSDNVSKINDVSIEKPVASIYYDSNICGHLMEAVLMHCNENAEQTFQWQRKNAVWENIIGATSSNYTSTTADGNHEIRVIITETFIKGGTPESTEYISSGVVIQHISAEKPIISAQPSLRYSSYSFGMVSETLTVAAQALSGYTYDYDWFHNGNRIYITNSPSYSLPADLSIGNHSYYCIVRATRNDNGLYNLTQSVNVELNVYNVFTSSARSSYNSLGGELSSSVSADVNGEFTAYLELKYTPSASNPMKLVFSGGALPEGTSIIFGDFSAAIPEYYYYTLSSAQSSIALMDFLHMGSTVSFVETASAQVRKYQFTVRLPQNNTATSAGICSLACGANTQSGIGFSYSVLNPTSVEPTITVTEAKNVSETVSVSFIANSSRSTDKLITVSLLKSGIPVGLSNYTGIRLNEQPPFALNGDMAVFVLGNGALENRGFTLTLNGLEMGEYNVKLSLSDSVSLCCPHNAGTVTAVTNTITVNAPKYSLHAELQDDEQRILSPGSKLKLKLFYRAENASSPIITTEISRKFGTAYDSAGTLWSSASPDISLDGSSGEMLYEISVPINAESGTYRAVFSLGDTIINYNFIIV